MPWKIRWSQEAALSMSGFDKKLAKRIFEKLEEASENPLHFFERLAGEEDYKLRVGDYRILVLLFHAQSLVFVEKIGHRKNVYKKKG